jgi:inositol phosphorylceramide synthase catalytic subunit
LIGFKTDQLWLSLIFNVFYFLSESTRKFIIGFSIFIVYWIIFDYMKAVPNYKINAVHIQDLYNTEKYFFGIQTQGSVITPNEYWKLNHSSFLDVLTGVFYLCWIPVPLAFAAWLFFKNKLLFLQFSLSFVFINMIGFVIYYVYPAAPPWYIQQYGTDFIPGTPGNTAGLSRFDAYFHVSVFKNLYAKSSNVFAAMPSLHSSYPLLVLYYGIKNKAGLINVIFAIVMGGIWFAAVYTSHHYILDVLAGITCAVIGIILFNKVLMQSKGFVNFINRYLEKIS